MTTMQHYLKAWPMMRLIRLVLALLIVAQGIYTSDVMFTIAGALLALMPILNIGCCGGRSCNLDTQKGK